LLHALDGVALVVEHVADALDQLDILRPVVAAAAATLHRLDLGEAGFPEAQHVLRQIEVFGYLADGAEGVGTFFHGATLARKQPDRMALAMGFVSKAVPRRCGTR